MQPAAVQSFAAPPAAGPPVLPERIHALDSLRAVAMFLGIALHGALSFLAGDFLAPWPVHDVQRHPAFNVMVFFIHGFRMHLFFLLAGFFARLLHERLGPRAFIKQRLLRIGLPFLAGPLVFVLPMLFIVVWSASWLQNPAALNLRPPRASVGPPTGHLWFLQFLLVHYALALALVWLATKFPGRFFARADAVFDSVMRSPLRIAAFVPLTVLCLWNGPSWGEAHHAGVGFVPAARAVAHYGLFFAIGWWLHRRRALLVELRRFVWPSIIIGVGLLLVHARILQSRPNASDPRQVWLKLTSLACAGVYAWAMTFALIGIFLRFASQPRPWARYLADASYWCYLAHLIPIVFLQVLLAEWRAPVALKFLLLVASTMALLLLSYQWFVRYTWVGTLLNGRRHRPFGVVPMAVSAKT